jgi:DNA modification methylase
MEKQKDVGKVGKWTLNKIHCTDAIQGLKDMPDQIVQCCVTSPPYWSQRDYEMPGQYGRENSPELYVEQLVEVFTEVKRVLKKDGTLWLNLGDAYWSSANLKINEIYQQRNNSFGSPVQKSRAGPFKKRKHPNLKPKDLIGLPWQTALALRNSGWFLRQDIIWHKPNPMPESVTDRCTKSHEYLFLLSKSSHYLFDHQSIKQPLQISSIQRLDQAISEQKGSLRVPGKKNGPMKAVGSIVGGKKASGISDKNKQFATRNANGKPWENTDGFCNKRSVWTVATRPFREAHFATFPSELITDCIKAGSRHGDLILDPFMGAGTTALASIVLHRNFLGFELNPGYIAIANKRISRIGNLFHQV